jgi:NAD dependent epimerase/dehydratase
VGNGYQGRALCLSNSFNFWGWLDGFEHPNLEIVTGDIRDYHYCLQITTGLDIVFHLGALIAIPFSYHSPESYIDTNIKGTSNICLASLQNKVARVIHTSTSEVYGTAKYVPIDEKHALQPQSPYSASKIGADAMAMSYFNAFNLPLVIARPFNTYGPRQSARAIIPTIITQLATGMKEIKLGDLRPTRDLNFVLDTCRGFLAIANAEKVEGEVFNIGSNYEITMHEVFEIIKDIMKSNAVIVEDSQRIRPEKSEVFRLWCDNSKIKQLTGFMPQYTIKTGLIETVKWFMNPLNLEKYKANIYNV